MAYVSSNRSATLSVASRLVEMMKEASEAYTAWRLYRRTLDELGQLSERELKDLGLNRSTLRQAAFEATYGRTAA